jgi:uncharacterized protein
MTFGLAPDSIESIRRVLARHPSVTAAIVFGSRALSRAHHRSDVDLALCGNLNPLDAERIALELEELPLPIGFDVQALDSIRHPALRDHIERAGQSLYRRLEQGAD